jgi:hypothetical protein
VLDAVCLVAISRSVSPGIANVVSSSLAACFVYGAAHRFAHHGERTLVGARLALYGLYSLALILAASLALGWLISAIDPYVGGAAAVISAKALITPPQFLSNFFVSRTIARAQVRCA